MSKRSSAQNSYYWVVVEAELSHYEANPTDLLKDVVECMGVKLTKEFVHELNKRMYNNGESTTKLLNSEKNEDGDAVAFMRFVDRIRDRHLHTHQHLIALPNEPPLQENYHED